MVLIYSWNVSLVRSWWESAHIQFNLWSVYYDMFLYDGTLCQLHLEGRCMLYTNCHYGHIQYVRHTVSVGKLSGLYINCFQFPWFRCIRIWYFPVMDVKRGVACFQRKGGWKKKEEADTPFCTISTFEKLHYIVLNTDIPLILYSSFNHSLNNSVVSVLNSFFQIKHNLNCDSPIL